MVASQAAWYRIENGPKAEMGKNLAKKKKMSHKHLAQFDQVLTLF